MSQSDTRTHPGLRRLFNEFREQQPPFSDKYEEIREVATGAMGIVYRATHKLLGIPVAIKIAKPEMSSDRFLREARLLAQITAPHVVAVHDFELIEGGVAILVMRWIDGESIDQLIRAAAGSLQQAQVLAWMEQVCKAMQSVSDQGIVHRDLKPANILIDRSSNAHVSDFGLATALAPESALTQTGETLGTPHYMAPEQAVDSHVADTRSDIYGFGATFYHALVGRPPFERPTVFGVLLAHKLDPVISPKSVNPSIDSSVSDLIERCLAKNPRDRFQSFAEISEFLKPTALATKGGPSPWMDGNDSRVAPHLEQYRQRRPDYVDSKRNAAFDDRYEFPGGRVVRVMRGRLEHQTVDALVSSDGSGLEMGGGVSAALERAAGPILAEEARRLTPVRVGRAVVTSAGNLPARFVIHGVSMGRPPGKSTKILLPSRDIVSEIMTSCFYHADTLHVTSIAFPLLGTGTGRLDRSVCLDTMFQFLARTFTSGLTSVQEARIVIAP